MKLPDMFQKIFRPTPEGKSVYLSLILDQTRVTGATWRVDTHGKSEVFHTFSLDVSDDTWEERTRAVDHLVTELEEKISGAHLEKVVLGLPPVYLTKEGDIESTIRTHIKRLTKALGLTPIGFVPITQAITYDLKIQEGVPPSVILLGVSTLSITVTVYKVGAVVAEEETKDPSHDVEGVDGVLRGLKSLEVLPSRILLYGGEGEKLEKLKGNLLKHPWPTRANFLHFPKIEILKQDEIARSVVVAGASEVTIAIGEETIDIPSDQPEEVVVPERTREESIDDGKILDSTVAEVVSAMPQVDIQESSLKEQDESADANVVMVSPEELGFGQPKEVEIEDEKPTPPRLAMQLASLRSRIKIPRFKFKIPSMISTDKTSARRWVIAGVSAVLALSVIFMLTWVLPGVKVTILATPHSVDETVEVTINSTATVIDSQTRIIPGRIQEKTVQGEKILPVTGKKKVGDPARGTVTIYNKSLVSRSFKKGTVLSAKSLNFTLDSDISVASASESIGSITFGKGDSAITAVDIGLEGNVAASTEFTFDGVSSTMAIARNDKSLTGGTSRDVTVVTRADYDALTESLTQDLLTKAKEELAGSVGGEEKIIDQTIDTNVTEKTYLEELDQEATEIHGKLTVVVSGVSYSGADLDSMLRKIAGEKIPSGYTILNERSQVELTKIQVKKDGTITATAHFLGSALPAVDISTLQQVLAGKKLSDAQEYLRTTSGVGGATFQFRWSIGKNRIPRNKNNISITVSVLE